jgi:hypothetical protein
MPLQRMNSSIVNHPQIIASCLSRIRSRWSPRSLGRSGAESVLGLARHCLEVSASSSSRRLSPLGLLAPVVYIPIVSSAFFHCLSSSEPYTFGSWQRGSRSWSKCASGCGESGDLEKQLEPPFRLRELMYPKDFRTASTAQSVRLVVALAET